MAKEEFSLYFSEFSWPWYMPSIDEYLQLVSNSEFKTVKVWEENADRHFPDTETMIGWLDQPSLVPFLACVPESHKAAFREYVICRMIDETKKSDGQCFETFRRINLFARK
jgi:trans-aconitate 2-methyltransferase